MSEEEGSEKGSQNPEGAEVIEEEPEEKLPEVNIHEETRKVKEICKDGLSLLSKTADNVSFAYVKQEINEKEIEGLYRALEFYPHLRYLNIKDNKIRDISMVANLHYLVYLEASSNEIKDVSFLENPHIQTYLQYLNLSKNQIKGVCPSFNLKRLRKLNLNENPITSLENFNGQSSIMLLEARKCNIKDLSGISDMDSLKELYLGENQIKTMDGVKNNQNLEVLFLRSNLVATVPDNFDRQGLGKLRHVNLRDNQIAKVSEIKKLLDIPSVNSITVHGANPYVEEIGDIQTQLIINLCLDKNTAEVIRGLNRLNKVELDDEAMQLAIDDLKGKLEEERIKKEEEEEARRIEEEAKKAEDDARKAEEDEIKRIEDEARRVEEEARKKEEDARKAEEDAKRAEYLKLHPEEAEKEEAEKEEAAKKEAAKKEAVAEEAKPPPSGPLKETDPNVDRNDVRKQYRGILDDGKQRKKDLKDKLAEELRSKLGPIKSERQQYRDDKGQAFNEIAELRDQKQVASTTEKETLKAQIRTIKQKIVDLKSIGHKIKQSKWSTQDEHRVYEKKQIDELIKLIETEKEALKYEIGNAYDEILNETGNSSEEVTKKLSENKKELKKEFTDNLENTINEIIDQVKSTKEQSKTQKNKEKSLKKQMTQMKESSPEEAALQKLREELNGIRTDIVKLRADSQSLRLSKKMTKTKIKKEHIEGKDQLKDMAHQELKKLDTIKSN